MRDDFLYCKHPTKNKKIKCFRLCHLNDLNAESLSSISPLVPQHCAIQWEVYRQSMERERQRQMQIRMYRCYSYPWKQKRKNPGALFLWLYNSLNVVDVWPLRVELLKRAGVGFVQPELANWTSEAQWNTVGGQQRETDLVALFFCFLAR